MSKINRIRIINLSYNNHTIRVDDELLDFGGESTLLSLRNGGGKSVLVQMLTAPFVHRRYRDARDRPFESYFTTNKPTFLLVEWRLDGDAGYVLTGMMVRRRQASDGEETNDPLEIVNLIYEYRGEDPCDIGHIPLTEETESGRRLKGYAFCRRMFEEWKKEKKGRFFWYDMSVSAQSRNYFEKLKEYRIYYREWESIIKKVNLKESGLSELFADARDERGLVEKWFLDAVESKLNQDTSRIRRFGELLYKYIRMYKENQSKLLRRETIRRFEEETEPVRLCAGDLKKKLSEQAEIENRLACLIRELTELSEAARGENERIAEEIRAVTEQIQIIRYEELSYEIYRILDAEQEITEQKGSEEEKHAANQAEQAEVLKSRNILTCAKVFEEYVQASQDQMEVENRLERQKEKDQDSAPERERLGYNLRLYYERERADRERRVSELTDMIKSAGIRQEELAASRKKTEDERAMTAGLMGGVKRAIEDYDRAEQEYNRNTKRRLVRNILGEYEPGIFDLLSVEMIRELDGKKAGLTALKKESEEGENLLRGCARELEDCGRRAGACERRILECEETMNRLNQAVEIRRTLLRYVDCGDDRLFDTPYLLEAYQRKLGELEVSLREREERRKALSEEYEKLRSGRVLELPKELEDALEGAGIHYIYGMEWLKRLDKDAQEKQRIALGNPFLPYSIILSERDIAALAAADLPVYTKFPVPVIRREDLETPAGAGEEPLVRLGKVSFYVLFNRELLDEERLSQLLEGKKKRLMEADEAVLTGRRERNLLSEKYDILRFQDLTKEGYARAGKSLKDTREEAGRLEEEIRALRVRQDELRQSRKEREANRRGLEEEIAGLERELRDMQGLKKQYEQYLENRQELFRLTDKKKRLEAQLEDCLVQEKKVQEEVYVRNQERLRAELDLEKAAQEAAAFSGYQPCELLNKDPEDMRARFDALTKEIHEGLKDLEEALAKAQKAFRKKENELVRITDKLGVKEIQYRNTRYDPFEEDRLLEKSAQLEKAAGLLGREINRLDRELAVKQEQERAKRQTLYQQLGRTEVKPREEISDLEFTARISLRNQELEGLKEEADRMAGRLSVYEQNLSALAEYEELKVTAPYEFERKLSEYDREELNRLQGSLKRDYRNKGAEITQGRQTLSEQIRQVMEMAIFGDEFYHNPLRTLYQIRENPENVLEQLDITRASYESLLEKLAADIAMVEKEQEKVTELLLDYVHDVHRNLDKIDKNSTITVRDHPIRMLRIRLPKWEEQEESIRQKLTGFIEDLTKSGLAGLAKNENVEEMIGARVTTKNLYDIACGIGNIEVRLYKIEEQKEYPISWAQVAGNSGGEGFLSAFVVLSSLLSYMRREDTDIFMQQEEGKVLVMDNPFAQTNAAHLLKPLMEISKKSNTQLICLTGLGGESIYSRFDNIYVLNLIPSGIRKGTMYLRGDHVKGDEADTEVMEASRFEVEEAEQLSFDFRTEE